MTTATAKAPISADLPELMQALKADIFKNLNCAKPGTINTFDATKNTATVNVGFKWLSPDGTTQDYPLLLDVMVFTLQGGGGFLRFPVSAGDPCLVIFADANLDAWYQNGTPAAPYDNRAHDISDGIAFVGINSLSGLLGGYLANTIRLAYAGAELDLQGGKVALKNQTTTLLVLLQNLVSLLETATIDTTHGVFTSGFITALETYALTLQELFYQ